jgi:hypothetical protein
MPRIWAVLFLAIAAMNLIACQPVDTTSLDRCEDMRGGHRKGNCY